MYTSRCIQTKLRQRSAATKATTERHKTDLPSIELNDFGFGREGKSTVSAVTRLGNGHWLSVSFGLKQASLMVGVEPVSWC